MFDEFSLNRFLRVFYPTAVFLFTVLAWNAAGQGSVDFEHPRKSPNPTWRAPAVLQPSCDTDRLAIQAGGSCRIDLDQ
jgi:hypothetical protein